MPGSPPISTSDPRTRPPPNTRLSSPFPRSMRDSSVTCMSSMRCGRTRFSPERLYPLPDEAAGFVLTTSST